MAHSKMKGSLLLHIWAFSNQLSFATQHCAWSMEILLEEKDFVRKNHKEGFPHSAERLFMGKKKCLETAGRLKK